MRYIWLFQDFKYLLLVYSADQKSGHDQHNDGKSELCFVGGWNGFSELAVSSSAFCLFLNKLWTIRPWRDACVAVGALDAAPMIKFSLQCTPDALCYGDHGDKVDKYYEKYLSKYHVQYFDKYVAYYDRKWWNEWKPWWPIHIGPGPLPWEIKSTLWRKELVKNRKHQHCFSQFFLQATLITQTPKR